jgi:LysM repeat protein
MKKFTAIVLLLVTIMAMSLAQAEASTVYKVKSGDTLIEISKEIGVPIEVIIEQNNISNPSNIYVGQRLIIRINIEYPNDQNKYGYYTIKAGDILWNIAQKYNTTVEKLVELNDIKDAYDLYIGRKLLVPLNNNQNVEEENNYYIVQEGDILWNIAQKYNTTVQKLVELNNIKNSYDLYVGRRLILPNTNIDKEEIKVYSYPLYYSYQVQEGDNLVKIADKFGVRMLEIMKANNMLDNINNIQVGSNLIIPLDNSNKFAYVKRYSKLLNNYYRVNADETLTDIAKKFNISEDVLRTINALGSEEKVRYGQKLLMPVSQGFFKKHRIYTVRKDEEYIADIAYENGVNIRSIVQANYLKDLNVKLKKGETIIVTLDEDSKTTWVVNEYN